MPSVRRLTRTPTVLNLAGILAALAIAGLLSGCSSSPPTPTHEPVTPLSSEQRDEVTKRLNETLAVNSLAQLKPNEPRTLCSNYEQANWDLDKVLDPLLEAGKDDADAWRDYHNHFTLVGILQDQSGLSFEEKVAKTVELLRAFCGSL